MFKEWYSVAEVSKATKISKARLYKLIDQGILDAKWFNNKHNISRDELLFFKRRIKDGLI